MTKKYKIKLKPMLATCMSPRDFMLGFGLEEGVCNAKTDACAKCKKSLTNLINFANIEFAYVSRLCNVVTSDTGIEIAKKNHLVF